MRAPLRSARARALLVVLRHQVFGARASLRGGNGARPSRCWMQLGRARGACVSAPTSKLLSLATAASSRSAERRKLRNCTCLPAAIWAVTSSLLLVQASPAFELDSAQIDASEFLSSHEVHVGARAWGDGPRVTGHLTGRNQCPALTPVQTYNRITATFRPVLVPTPLTGYICACERTKWQHGPVCGAEGGHSWSSSVPVLSLCLTRRLPPRAAWRSWRQMRTREVESTQSILLAWASMCIVT